MEKQRKMPILELFQLRGFEKKNTRFSEGFKSLKSPYSWAFHPQKLCMKNNDSRKKGRKIMKKMRKN